MNKRSLWIVALASLPLSLWSCGGTTTDTTPTLTVLQANIFTPSCAKSGCHLGDSPEAGLRLSDGDTYGLLVGSDETGIVSTEASPTKRVKPADPDNSYLVKKIQGDPGISGLRMPKDGPPYLTADQIQAIRAWIQAGAKNN
jgi:hypothetical protein